MRLTEDRFPSTSSAPAEGSAGADAAHAHLPAELERRHSEAALRDSEARFRQLFEKIPNISVQGYDAQRRVIFWNPASTELYGYSAEEVLGRALDDVLIPPELGIDHESLHRDWNEHGIEIPAGEILLRHKDGHRVPVFSSHVMQRNADGQPEMYCVDVDLSAHKRAQAELKLAASVFSHAREGILVSDADGVIVEANAALCALSGYARAELIGQRVGLFRSGRHGAEFYADMHDSLRTRGHWSGEVWNRRPGGEHYPVLLTISALRDDAGTLTHYVALYADIAAQKAHEAELEFLASHDALTGLPNRVLLRDRLEQALAQARRRGQRVAVAYLDLDGFKHVNDQHGHELGDRLLQHLAGCMRASLREGDTIARLGGDEFAAVLVDLGEHSAFVPFVNRLLEVISCPVSIDGIALEVSASIGVSIFPQPDEVDADQLLRQADQAMYQAKLAGKSRFSIFDTELDRSVRGHHETLARVREAIARDEFVLFYQPKVNMRSGEVIGLEALIRWQHPQRGLLPPGAFLPDVEQSPLVVAIGEWVIATALAQHASWRAQGLDLPVSVNISADHLQRQDFIERLEALLAPHADIGPGRLELEVLETSALGNLEHVAAVIRGCRRLGVRFALDDFGTGYASLAYLKHLPANVLKIDQTFVRDMLEDPDDLAIVEGVIGLAKAFRREVVAEGVETLLHGRRLLQLGCETAQGYGIARPMPADAVPGWVRAWCPDPSWADACELDRSGALLLYAMAEVALWCKAVHAFIAGETADFPDVDFEQSALGRWLEQAADTSGAGSLRSALASARDLLVACKQAPALDAAGRSALANRVTGCCENLRGTLESVLVALTDPCRGPLGQRFSGG